MTRIRCAPICLGFGLWACGGDSRPATTSPLPTAPTTSTTRLYLDPEPLAAACTAPGAVISPGPSVLVLDQSAKPMPNVAVHFRVTDGAGVLQDTIATTNTTGIATTASWRMGPDAGYNAVVASAGDQSVRFGVTTGHAQKVAVAFELTSIGGQPLPLTYSGGGRSWTITGGHFYLAGDGSYALGLRVPGGGRARDHMFDGLVHTQPRHAGFLSGAGQLSGLAVLRRSRRTFCARRGGARWHHDREVRRLHRFRRRDIRAGRRVAGAADTHGKAITSTFDARDADRNTRCVSAW